jgi:hypothetical protein
MNCPVCKEMMCPICKKCCNPTCTESGCEGALLKVVDCRELRCNKKTIC